LTKYCIYIQYFGLVICLLNLAFIQTIPAVMQTNDKPGRTAGTGLTGAGLKRNRRADKQAERQGANHLAHKNPTFPLTNIPPKED
jgi:hypothetical protein